MLGASSEFVVGRRQFSVCSNQWAEARGYGRVLRRRAVRSLSRAFAAWLACLILSLKERRRFCSIKVGSKPSFSPSNVFPVDGDCLTFTLVFIVQFRLSPFLKADVIQPSTVGLMPLDGFSDSILK